jgi:type VI secretion system protein VasJ
MRITVEDHLTPVLAPLDVNDEGHPVGEPLEDTNDYLALDEEMMKIGSLQHAHVDWDTAETLAVRMLSGKGKDLKVLGHLVHCLQHGGNGVRFALSLRLLARSVGQPWWSQAYPFAGGRGAKLRTRLFQQFIQRSVKLVSSLDFHNAEDEFEACQASLEELQQQAAANALPCQNLDELSRQLLAQRPTASTSAAETTPSDNTLPDQPDANRQAATTTQPSSAKAPELRMEAGNERSNRQSLLKMADFLLEQTPGEPLAYRLRRFAIWGAIQALPNAREDGKTELAPVSADRVADYRDAIARGSDHDLWERIENSLTLSPYWLEGHRLSAGVAKQLGHPRCAEAIREEAQRFVERLSGIDALAFNNGVAFIDDETKRWLFSGSQGTGASSDGGEAWQAGLQEARDAMADGNVGAALKVLDQGLSRARSPRDSAYWRLASADLLHEAGLESLAQQHYRTLHQTVTALALEQWEPTLVSRLEAALNASH